MLRVETLSMVQSQNFLIMEVLWKCNSGSTSAVKTYCFTLSKMTSHSSTSTTSKASGRLASKTSMCSSLRRSRAEASSWRVRVLATSRCGQRLLMHFSSYIRLELPMTYVRRPKVRSARPPASTSDECSSRCRRAGGCSRSTVTNMGIKFVKSDSRCTSAERPTCRTFFELLTTKSRLMMDRRLSMASSLTIAISSGWSATLLLALRSSSSPGFTPSSWCVTESLLKRWADKSNSCAWTSHHSSLASAPKFGISATMLRCCDELVVMVERMEIPATRILGCWLCMATRA
mmetsp:Transcript_13760/g.39309  ORF Transcript_13760/g.39309 Transcript_13760/m.39309 type:complete len:289 (+) Transcript_13760:305-1171(+)